MSEKIQCQECGALVYPSDLHTYKDCQMEKMLRKLQRLSEFQSKQKKEIDKK